MNFSTLTAEAADRFRAHGIMSAHEPGKIYPMPIFSGLKAGDVARFLRVGHLSGKLTAPDLLEQTDEQRFAHLDAADRKRMRKQLAWSLRCPA